ncbi:uncharacterized protein LOC116232751 [Phasianus colchicus]|uniref:uncharacterized protein LOC116232751 n=1 Tax=Phasianus colchicus TaxID=9054 RepID=UPI00129E3F93|nr:uncharacterized protein LOC116232751 [Phasianus colchicus]
MRITALAPASLREFRGRAALSARAPISALPHTFYPFWPQRNAVAPLRSSARTCPLQIVPEQGFGKPESSPQAAFYYQFLHPTPSQRFQKGPLRPATSASPQRALCGASRRLEGTCAARGPTAGPLGREEAALSPLRDKAAGCLHGAQRRGGGPTPMGEKGRSSGRGPRRAVTCGAEHEVQGAVPRCCHSEESAETRSNVNNTTVSVISWHSAA